MLNRIIYFNKVKLILLLLFVFSFSIYSQSENKSTTGSLCNCVNISVIQADTLITANVTNENFIIIDVRTPGEFVVGHIENAINIDYYGSNYPQDIDALDKSKKYLIHCLSGGRSGQVFNYMNSSGFSEVYNMLGGILQWTSQGFPVVTGSFTFDIDIDSENILIYPNPAINDTNISFGSKIFDSPSIEILNVLGKSLIKKDYPGLIQTIADIDLSDLHRGIHFVKIQIDNSVIIKKLIIN